MDKKTFIVFSVILPILLSVGLTFLLFLSTDDLSLTGVARSDFLLLTEKSSPKKPLDLTQSKEEEHLPTVAVKRELYIYETDMSNGNTVLINQSCIDLDPAVLEKRIEQNNDGSAPTVLILHTHPDEKYAERIRSDTLPPDAVGGIGDVNDGTMTVVDAGAVFAKTLEEYGCRVIHVTATTEKTDNAWEESKKTVAAYLAAYPSIRYVVDIHREIHRDSFGNLLSPVTPDRQSAQIEITVGTDAENELHSNYEKNLALAMTFKEKMDAEAPGLSLPVKVVNQTLNQELSEGFLTLSIGSEGSDGEQIKSGAQRAAAIFAKTIQFQ